MNSDEIRKAFLSFFESKGHKVIPSSSLIPHGDPTLLLTSAGMVQIKPYFTGAAVPPAPRLVSCQKCFRGTDIELVGDPTHLTFFEMLGNFSVGDYFKKEAIEWAWEFVTGNLKIPPQRLWITIFLDDDEAFGFWRGIGIPEERILRFGEEHNFWGPAGSSGPCGPDSEIFFDFGEEYGCGKPDCAPNCDCNRFTELWNLVFTQYDQAEDGTRTLLPKPNIDTGMGLERTAAVMQGKASVYDTDLFASLISDISKFMGKNYGSNDEVDKAMRVIVEHGRAITFLIADGVMPGNEGRGYVLRRLLRRTALFGRRLGIEKPFLNQIAGATVGSMARVYPELQQRQNFIYQVLEAEEERFGETLNTGLELLDGIMAALAGKKKREIPGEEAFKLYDTYGFPVELTTEIAAENGYSVDLEGFEREMEAQRERAKVAQVSCADCGTRLKESDKECPNCGSTGKDYSIMAEVQIGLEASASILHHKQWETEPSFVGYHKLRHEDIVVSLLVDNKSVETVQKGQQAGLILESTPFYGEMGGQEGDTGEIHSQSGRFVVTNTIRVLTDIIVHQGHVTTGSLSVGDKVEAEVDRERRLDIARNHTATHLLQFALRQVLGEQVEQRGSLVASDRFRFDFSYLTSMMPEEIQQVQRIVNEKIRRNLEVYDEVLPYKEAIEQGAIALFDEKYGDEVRVLKIDKPFISAELCGGTHVMSTGEIGLFHITSESSIGAGLRRIEAVTGREAEVFIEQRLSGLEKIAQSLGTSADDARENVSGLVEQLDKERKQTLALERELSRRIAESLLGQAEVVNGVTVLAARVRDFPQQVLREMADFLRERLKSAVVVLGTVHQDRPAFLAAVTPDLVARGYNAGDIVKQVAEVTGGGGGGRATLAQAGGRNKDKLDEALRLVKSLI